MDWANEVAESVVRPTVKTIGDREALVAAALRKAKADGMREAVATITTPGKYSGYDVNACSDVIRHANKIEKGKA